jgi:hypothetical protein
MSNVLVEKSSNTIDKSTLQALLLYCDVDVIDLLFFTSVSKKLKDLNKENLSKDELFNIFDFSKDNFSSLSVPELATVRLCVIL